MPDPGGFGSHSGIVAEFDAHAGIGRVVDGDVGWLFHCTSIADGSRVIEAGEMVVFRVGPAGPGRWEAFEVRSAHEEIG